MNNFLSELPQKLSELNPVIAAFGVAFAGIGLLFTFIKGAFTAIQLIQNVFQNRRVPKAGVKKVFWKKPWNYEPHIMAAHRYERTDQDPSGFRHLGQNSGKHQWSNYIELVKTFSFLGFTRYKVIAKDPKDIILVLIQRNGKEEAKPMNFNYDGP